MSFEMRNFYVVRKREKKLKIARPKEKTVAMTLSRGSRIISTQFYARFLHVGL